MLQYLFEVQVPIVAIVTQPDRPQKRSNTPQPSCVKKLTQEQRPHLPIFQPEKASDPTFIAEIDAFQADLFLVVAYGQILSKKLLHLPRLGCLNVHSSLLPHYRGAAPMQRALLAGETHTGISIQKMVYELDAGDVLVSKTTPLAPSTTFGELQKTLSQESGPLLFDVLRQYEVGIPPTVAQNHALATYAPKIQPEEQLLDWNKQASHLHNQIRALSPKPGAWCWLEPNLKRIKILRTEVVPLLEGTVGEIRGDAVVCGTGALRLLEVQVEGKSPMPAATWLRGAPHVRRLYSACV